MTAFASCQKRRPVNQSILRNETTVYFGRLPRADGLEIVAAPGNVAVPGEAEAMVETAISMPGTLYYLFNNAGTP